MDDQMVGAFFFFHHLEALTPQQRRGDFGRLSSSGVGAVLTESDTYQAEIIDEARGAGLEFWGGISCFYFQNSMGNVLENEPNLTPILSTGQPRPTLEWYNGVIPTSDSYNDRRRALMVDLNTTYEFDGFVLDFIRWPMHWELELRPGYPPPLDNSFDPITLGKFHEYSGITVPEDVASSPGAAASWLLTDHPREWIDFKCAVITDYVRSVKADLNSATGRNLPLAICGVPIQSEWVGQRFSDLAEVADLICPMSYHPVLYRSPSWVKDNVASCLREAPGRVAPMLQIDTNGAEFGADFGPGVTGEEFERVLTDVLGLDVRGAILFTGTELLKSGRLEVLRTVRERTRETAPRDDANA